MIISGENKFVSHSTPIYYGSTMIDKIYVGDTQVYPEEEQSIIDVDDSGGYTAAPFSVSLTWNKTQSDTSTDLDLRAEEPSNDVGKSRIVYYGSKYKLNQRFTWDLYNSLPIYDSEDPSLIRIESSACGGIFDKDTLSPGSEPAVENIIWPVANKLLDGYYSIYVTCYSGSTLHGGFNASITLFGNIYDYEYTDSLYGNTDAWIAVVKIQDKQLDEIIDGIDLRDYFSDPSMKYATRITN